MRDEHAVALTGATGFTGRLTARALLARGIQPTLVGRSAERLAAVARDLGEPLPTRVVDDLAPQTWADALEGARVVVATAGPFARVGEPALALAARRGLGYVDSTGEQAFVRMALSRYQATAEAAGACLVPSCAYESALADWAASLAAEALGPGELDAIEVLYRARPGGTTAGTRLSALGVLTSDGYARVDGRLVAEAPGARRRHFELDGARVTAVSFPAIEALVVPRHVSVRSVRSFMAVGARSARVVPLATTALRRLGPLALPWLERVARRGPEPVTEARARARFTVAAEARRGGRTALAVVEGTDSYGLTAEILADAARSLLGGARVRGVVAPSEAFDPAATLAALGRFGVSFAVRS